jgi:hypothetical protein
MLNPKQFLTLLRSVQWLSDVQCGHVGCNQRDASPSDPRSCTVFEFCYVSRCQATADRGARNRRLHILVAALSVPGRPIGFGVVFGISGSKDCFCGSGKPCGCAAAAAALKTLVSRVCDIVWIAMVVMIVGVCVVIDENDDFMNNTSACFSSFPSTTSVLPIHMAAALAWHPFPALLSFRCRPSRHSSTSLQK